MEKFSINAKVAGDLIRIANETVSAGINIPEDANWYTVRPFNLSYICTFKRDLKDMEAIATMSDGVEVNMLKNPIGTFIFPTCILRNFNFARITPKNAQVITAMIRNKSVIISGKQYNITDKPVLTYDLASITKIGHYIQDLKVAATSETDTVINVDNRNCAEFTAHALMMASRQEKNDDNESNIENK